MMLLKILPLPKQEKRNFCKRISLVILLMFENKNVINLSTVFLLNIYSQKIFEKGASKNLEQGAGGTRTGPAVPCTLYPVKIC